MNEKCEESNRVVLDSKDVKIHWKFYMEQLFKSMEPCHFEVTRDLNSFLKLLKQELMKATKNSENRKFSEPDQVLIEKKNTLNFLTESIPEV